MPRSSDFTQETADAICQRIALGQSLREITRDENMPDQSTVYRWLAVNEPFREQYARARSDQADYFLDELLEIADDGSNDWMLRNHGQDDDVEVPNHDHINRSKLRVDARKWAMSKLAPKKYGEKLTTEHTGADGKPMPPLINLVISGDKPGGG